MKTTKRLVSCLLALAVCAAMSACGEKSNDDIDSNNQTGSEVEEVSQETSTSNIEKITEATQNKIDKKTESKAEESDNCIVRFVLFVSDDFKNAQKDIQLTFKGNGEELTGTLGFSNDYSLNIALKKYVSYELTFSGDLGGYEILGADKYVYFEEDSTVNLTMLGAAEQAQSQDVVTEQASGEMTEEQRIVSEYVAKLNEFVESSAENAKALDVVPLVKTRNYLKRTGDCYNSETLKTLTEFEQRLYWILCQNPDMMFRDNFDLMEKEDIAKSRYVSSIYELGGKYQEFIEMTIENLWAFQLEQTKAMGGAVPDYFKVYMDLKNGVVNEPVE